MKDQIDRIIDNLVNGNLTDAVGGAKKVSSFRISMRLRQIYGWSFDRATAAAAYLKGDGTFQQYCDAK